MSKALFDPGFSKLFNCSFSYQVEVLYLNLNKIKNFGQKRSHFLMINQKIEAYFNFYLGFYLGCMLWGAILKSLGNEKIEGNPFIGSEFNKEQSLEEIYYMKDFVKKFDRDMKYYLSKPFVVDEKKLKILSLYEEFTDANEGFINTDTTDKIKLVGDFDKISKDELKVIEEKIYSSIESNSLGDLLEFCDKM